MKAHPLTKLQLWMAIIWAITSLISLSRHGSQPDIWSIISTISFISLGVITTAIGWNMIVRRQVILYPQETLVISFVHRFRGNQAADRLKAKYITSGRRNMLGTLNLITGSGCFLLGIWILIILI
jgi:hypothetical protein